MATLTSNMRLIIIKHEKVEIKKIKKDAVYIYQFID